LGFRSASDGSQTMKQLLEVAFVFEVEVELPDELEAAEAVASLHARLHTESFSLMHGAVDRPARVLGRAAAVRPPFKHRPDEFRCDSCLREFSNDEKTINDGGDELCNNCKDREHF
jgi:hypothetical protein